MEVIQVDKLILHPQNDYFFDDIEGSKWLDFIESVETSGIIEPIVISQDKVVVSGHQRVRACKELDIKEIPCRIKIYDDTERWSKDDLIIKELIETNIKQRGLGNTNPIKLARCVAELEKLYGIQNGGNRRSEQDNLTLKTQNQLANELGFSKQQLQDYKKLLTLIPEIQDLVGTGSDKLSATTAYKVYARLSPEEQRKLFLDLGVEKISKMTKSQAESEVEKLLEENERLKTNERKWYEDSQKKGEEIRKLKNKKEEVKEVEKVVEKVVEVPVERVVEIVKEVIPEDYHNLQNEVISLKMRLNLKIEPREELPKINESEFQELAEFDVNEFKFAINQALNLVNDFIYCDEQYRRLEVKHKQYLLDEIKMLENNIDVLKNQITLCGGISNE